MKFAPLNLQNLFAPLQNRQHIALAVSGGPDSIALLHLIHQWHQARPSHAPPLSVTVLTVNHHLRPEAGFEADWTRQQAEKSGFCHATLHWQPEKPTSAVQENARKARYTLMANYCQTHQLSPLVTAHHLDDQVETFWMRLARGSGVDGLASMQKTVFLWGMEIFRPFLGIHKQTLLDILQQNGLSAQQDSSNHNADYERVRVRNWLHSKSYQGPDSRHIARTVHRMGQAQKALEFYTRQSWEELAHWHRLGFVHFSYAALAGIPEEILLRMLQKAMVTIRGKEQAIPLLALEKITHMIHESQNRTVPQFSTQSLAGCLIQLYRGHLFVFREGGRIATHAFPLPQDTVQLWDHRFFLRYCGPLNPVFVMPLWALRKDQKLLEKLKKKRDHFPQGIFWSLPVFLNHKNELIAIPSLKIYAHGAKSKDFTVSPQ